MDIETQQYLEEELVAIREFFVYIADLGRVGFVVAFILVTCGAAAETIYPGLFFNHISPQRLVVALVIFGAMSMLGPVYERSAWRLILFALAGCAIATLVVLFAQAYFAQLDEHLMLTIAMGVAAALVVVGSIHSVVGGPRPVKKE